MSAPRLPLDEEATGLRLARAAIGRLDKVDPSLTEAHRQIKKLGAALAVVLQGQEKSRGEPDWLTCRDPGESMGLLGDTWKWLDECGRWHNLDPVACWPWHPQAVALLLSVSRHYRAAYSDTTRPVLDLLTQYIPTVRRQTPDIIGNLCNANDHYATDGVAYRYDVSRLDAMAIWWATDRTGLAPGLSPTG